MNKYYLFIFFLLAGIRASYADTIMIRNFVVKENPFGKDEIAVVATDTAGVIQENVNGVFRFTVNGFDEDMKFDNGTAFYRHKLDKSSFIYLKHSNDAGTRSILYYVYKQDTKLTPIRISWMALVLVPLILVLLGYMFKRFIIIAAILLCIFIYFNHSNGLSVPTFFETIFDGLKHLFSA